MQESGLNFNFPKDWKVIKFDEHRFYQYVNGIGLKGVDFICIKANGELLLIEVKNYADRFPQNGIKPALALLDNPIPYAEQIAIKFEDSTRLIEVIHKFYLRKFWFRTFAQKLSLILSEFFKPNFDWMFWLQAYQALSSHPPKTRLIWWMELGDEVSKVDRSMVHIEMTTFFMEEDISVSILDRFSEQEEIQAS